MSRSHAVLAYEFCEESAKAESVGDHFNASKFYEQAGKHFDISIGYTTDPHALQALQLLRDHCQHEEQFQQSMYKHYKLNLSKQNETQSIQPQADNSEVGLLRAEFYNLFIRPWENFWSILENETDSQPVRNSYSKTLHNCQRNLGLLMEIALSGKNGGTNMPGPDNNLSAKIMSLSSALNSVQIARLQAQVQELQNTVQHQQRMIKEHEENRERVLRHAATRPKDLSRKKSVDHRALKSDTR